MIYPLQRATVELEGKTQYARGRLFSSFEKLNEFLDAYRDDEESHIHIYDTPDVCVGHRYQKRDGSFGGAELGDIQFGITSISLRCLFTGVEKHYQLLETGLEYYSKDI